MQVARELVVDSRLEVRPGPLVQEEEAGGERDRGDERDREHQPGADPARPHAHELGLTSLIPAARTVSIGGGSPSTVSLRRR